MRPLIIVLALLSTGFVGCVEPAGLGAAGGGLHSPRVVRVAWREEEEEAREEEVRKEKAKKFSTRWPPPAAPEPKPLDWSADKKLYTPADVSRAVALDAAAAAKVLDERELVNVRYLSTANVPEELRPVYFDVVSWLMNSLSREKDVTIPVFVGPDNVAIRVNLKDYDVKAADWDKLGLADPYFHQRALEKKVTVVEKEKIVKEPYTVKEPYKVTKRVLERQQFRDQWGRLFYQDVWVAREVTEYREITKYREKTVSVETTTREDEKPKEKVTPGAAWLDGEAVAALVKLLATETPILRADWFIANASLPPFYYDLLRLKTLDDAKDLAIFDKRAERITKSRATVVFSGSFGKARRVARNNRLTQRVSTALGSWWETFDFKTSIKEQNVVHNFLTNKRDGGEIIFSLPNGLQAYFLVNNKDVRVDEVPIEIAVDGTNQDARVRSGRSCMTCHTQGIQPFVSDFKLQLKPNELTDLGLKFDKDDPDAAVNLAREIRRVFQSPDFTAVVRVDNVRYNNAVKGASGKTAAAMAALFGQLYDDYQEVPMEADRLVYEAGVSDLDVQAAIATRIDNANNGVLLRRLLSPPLAIRRDQWEEAYGDFMLRVLAWQAAKKALPKGARLLKEGKK